MRSFGACLTLLLGLGLSWAGPGKAPAAAADPEVKEAEVRKAVARGLRWLKREQEGNGSFGKNAGETALCLLALRHSGVAATERACLRAAKHLVRKLPDGTVYAAALGVLALLAQDPTTHERKIQALVDDLTKGQCKNGQWTYSYRATAKKTAGDNSNTQIAILALASAHAHRFKVGRDVFARCGAYFRRTQNEDGGYGYSDNQRSKSYASMTAGGAMALVLCAAVERRTSFSDAALTQLPEVRKALDWLARDFDPSQNRGAARAFGSKNKTKKRSDNIWKHYWLWSLERACSIPNVQKLGQADWYLRGARHLLDTQHKNGSWNNPEQKLHATCFALLFFARSGQRVTTPPDRTGPITPTKPPSRGS